MKLIHICILGLLGLILYSCKTKVASKQFTPAEKLLQECVDAHGGTLYDKAHYEFVFRGNKYTFQNDNGTYVYTSIKEKEGQVTFDKMENHAFSRTVDNEVINLDEKKQASYGASLNSVIYFATLPHKLQDPAVNLMIKEPVKIKDETYDVLQVSFDEEGGGKDHDDIYYYWINSKTKRLDYLAYNFHVNNGGVRFRSAYNTRNVNGILFQDYINYKAPVGTPLSELPSLYTQDKLTELSVIATEDVKSL